MSENKTATIEVESYTKRRRVVLRRLLVNLIRKEHLTNEDLKNVVDLGSYEGSSTMALRDVGAKEVVSVDKNPFALSKGHNAGYIEKPIESDMADYVAQMDENFHGTVTAFNCILYLPETDIPNIIDNLGNKLAPGSKFIFTFSKTQEAWISKFSTIFNHEQFSTQFLTGLTQGELDYNCCIATKKANSLQ